ncbi:MAG TPA: hypothetical protein VM600_04410, partial [Actinomycetota bacterium]|nr:hypothetical protein [Actinomycetota bacterium]
MKHISVRVLLLLALAVSGTQLLAAETFNFRAGDLVIQLSPDIPGGHLTMSLGPLGELTWKTHAGPLNVNARFLIRPTAEELPSPEEFRDLRLAFILRKIHWLVIAGLIAGAIVALDRPRERQLADMGIGAGALVGVALLFVGITAVTFNANALRDPSYRGPIKDAPRILQLLKEVQRDWSSVERNINAAVAGLERLHS